ncbi:peptidoglycan DD-metalloendopeptidase family protein [Massilia sp. CMS3.1]|uniref:peptidoglycan DD-metalloendopeptidase family protein n=1 Tax=Massilia sp. CMS3.1 TaxID=3373083 RepID=UPI003EE6B0E6
MTFSHFPLLFLQASISAMISSGVAWALLHLARRRWPGLDARRTPWLLAQLTAALTLVLAMLPAASQWSLFAAASEPGVAGWAWHVPSGEVTDFLQAEAGELSGVDLLPALAWLWLMSCVSGAVWHALRWRRVGRDLRALLFVADRLDAAALHAHPAFARHRGALPPVLEIDAPVSPMLAGLLHPVLLLPRHVRDLPPMQQQLIVAHELMHLRRRDHLWQHAGTVLQVVLWFVPAMHSFHGRLQWALELGCDRAVLAGRPQGERRSYAAALLAQLAMQVRAGSPATPELAPASLAFGVRGVQAVAERIRLIRDAQSIAHVPLASSAALLLLPALCGASVLLQPQFAWQDAGQGGLAAPAWQAPLEKLRVTSSFGSINRPGGKPHQGMDFGAPRGTAVLAPADGKVAISTDRYDGGLRYGKVVVIEHASGTRTLYAHLDQRMVVAGERVRAGQRIALSGATGKVTGPHLHFEVSRQGAHIDPQALLGGAR